MWIAPFHNKQFKIVIYTSYTCEIDTGYLAIFFQIQCHSFGQSEGHESTVLRFQLAKECKTSPLVNYLLNISIKNTALGLFALLSMSDSKHKYITGQNITFVLSSTFYLLDLLSNKDTFYHYSHKHVTF